ncbi:MAG: VOC family protein, partial [bacterium]
MKPKNTICLWFEKDAEEAARFYCATFPDSAITTVLKSPMDLQGAKEGAVVYVELTILGIPCMALNGGPVFPQTEAFSFLVMTDDQAETDRYWDAIIGNGGTEGRHGWCKDRWGVSWQISPRVFNDAMTAGGAEARRVIAAAISCYLPPIKKP